MAEVRLPPLRIGLSWSADIKFPPGFLNAPEKVKGALHSYAGSQDHLPLTNVRNGDIITWSLLASQTQVLKPGDYVAEAIIYDPAKPTADVPLSDNIYIVEVDYSPSQAGPVAVPHPEDEVEDEVIITPPLVAPPSGIPPAPPSEYVPPTPVLES